MRVYLLSLGAGILVGVIYGFLNIRSPAPPVVALVGLFGILLGEQVVPMTKRLMADHPIHLGWIRSESIPHVFGHMSKASTGISPKTERPAA
jgi:XapX domain-containing protein